MNMILSPGRKYVFVHIPKTGGTSMALALEARARADDIMLGDTPKASRRRKRLRNVKTRGRLWKHSSLADIEGLLPDTQLRSLYAFTLVRNPWDRVVSLYHWLRNQGFEHPSVQLAKATDFSGFIADEATQFALRQSPVRAYMTHADGQEQCDTYIRLEHFEADAAPLFRHLGFSLTLDRVNRSDRGAEYRPYYTDHTAEIIAEACADDIQRFGYRF